MTITITSAVRCAGGGHLTVTVALDGAKPVSLTFGQEEIDAARKAEELSADAPWLRDVVLHMLRTTKIEEKPADIAAFDAALAGKVMEV